MRKIGIRGTINIFVALMMIPTVGFTGLMVDFSRLQMATVEVNNAADLAASSAIAYYDGLLQDVYGLYATSQNEAERQKFSEEYARAALSLDDSGGKSMASLNLFTGGNTKNPLKVEVSKNPGYEKYSLKNTAYLKYEIGQYMKYRVAFSIADIFDDLMGMAPTFTNADKSASMANKDNEFVSNEYNEICRDMNNLKEKYRKLYGLIDKAQSKLAAFNTKVTNDLRDIKDIYDQLDEEIRDSYFLNTNVLYDEINEKAESIQNEIDEYKKIFEDIKALSNEIEADTTALSNKIDSARNKLSAGKGTVYSNLFVEGIHKQLGEDKDKLITGLKAAGGSFANNASKFDNIKYGTYTIKKGTGSVYDDVFINSSECGGGGMVRLIVSNLPVVNISLTPFDPDRLDKLKEAIDSDNASDPDVINSKINEYNAVAEEVPHDKPNLSRIKVPSNYTSESGPWADSATDDGVLSNLTLNRLLLVEYGVQMFSNYVTNRRIKNGSTVDEKTLSGIPFTRKMNYMYGAELEYVYWGKDSAQTNYNAVIITLSAIFASRNLAFTFMDNTIKGEIALIRAIPYVGWILAEAYRAAIVAAETIVDINTLINGKKVPLIKKANKSSDYHWRSSIFYTAAYLAGASQWGQISQKKEGKDGFYYYEYLRMLILFNFFAGNDSIAHRISTLIELNMNNYMGKNGGVEKGTALSNLSKFKMNKAFVVVDTKLTGSMPYFFISMPYLSKKSPGGGATKMEFEITKTRSY